MDCYHMTSLDKLPSIEEKGLIPKNEANSKLIGDRQVKVFFSDGFAGAIALFVDFQLVYDRIKSGEMTVLDAQVLQKVRASQRLADYLGEGVYLCFDGTHIENERNFENGCTGVTIAPEALSVCVLRKEDGESVIFSRFEIIKYMMAQVQPEEIRYYGANYPGAPDFEAATGRIQEKVRRYYVAYRQEIAAYAGRQYRLESMPLGEFLARQAKKNP